MVPGMIQTVAPNALNPYTCYEIQIHGWREHSQFPKNHIAYIKHALREWTVPCKLLYMIY